MQIKNTLLASVVSATIAGTMSLPAIAGTEAGDGVVGGQIAIQSSDLGDNTLALATASYFLTEQVEVGGTVFWSGSDDFDLINLGVIGQYNFVSDSDLVPFVGGGYTLSLGDFDDTDFLTAFAGARQFVDESVAIRGEIRFLKATDSDFDTADSTTLSLGIEWFF